MKFTFEESGMTVDLIDRFVEWAKAYQTSMLDAHELMNLAALLTAFPVDDDNFVVEIGAYLGTTTVYMARVLEALGKNVPILSIDPFERFQPDSLNPQGNYSAYMSNIVSNHVEDRCLPLVAFSYDAAPVIAENIGALVLDGDHRYPVASKDLSLYAPKVREGGYIFVDDYGSAYPDVVRAVDEFLAENTEFTVHAKSYFVVAERKGPPGKRRRAHKPLKSSTRK